MEYFKQYQDDIKDINKCLDFYMPNIPISQASLFDSIHYSLFSGGKRVRPVLFIESYRMLGGNPQDVMPFAAAIEMIHTYSLIHDDLPSMDDDEERRGKPTNHMIFGEATALLAGDALLTAAFETMSASENISHLDPSRVLKAVHSIAWASGAYGMAGGQMLDLNYNSLGSSVSEITAICRLKTGALIACAAESAAILADASPEESDALISFAQNIGLTFQIMDDLLDFETPASDKVHFEGPSFVSLIGDTNCRKAIDFLTEKAKENLSIFKDPGFLLWFADFLSVRVH